MVKNQNGRNVDYNQYDPDRNDNIFDDDIIEDVNSVQEPYPDNDEDDLEDIEDLDESDGEVDGNENIHEYEDNDHPHESRPPSAVMNDYKGASGTRKTNAFQQQNPLQNTYPSSDQDS